MPLKLNVGLMKTIGQPQYGSLSASCHVEIELECSLLDGDSAAFQDRARRTFAACRRAVEAELAIGDLCGPQCPPALLETAAGATSIESGASTLAAEESAIPVAVHNGAINNGNESSDRSAQDDAAQFLPASASQLDYIRCLASRIGRAAALRVEVLAIRRFGKLLAELSRGEATRLILTLRSVKAGQIDWKTALEESAV